MEDKVGNYSSDAIQTEAVAPPPITHKKPGVPTLQRLGLLSSPQSQAFVPRSPGHAALIASTHGVSSIASGSPLAQQLTTTASDQDPESDEPEWKQVTQRYTTSASTIKPILATPRSRVQDEIRKREQLAQPKQDSEKSTTTVKLPLQTATATASSVTMENVFLPAPPEDADPQAVSTYREAVKLALKTVDMEAKTETWRRAVQDAATPKSATSDSAPVSANELLNALKARRAQDRAKIDAELAQRRQAVVQEVFENFQRRRAWYRHSTDEQNEKQQQQQIQNSTGSVRRVASVKRRLESAVAASQTAQPPLRRKSSRVKRQPSRKRNTENNSKTEETISSNSSLPTSSQLLQNASLKQTLPMKEADVLANAGHPTASDLICTTLNEEENTVQEPQEDSEANPVAEPVPLGKVTHASKFEETPKSEELLDEPMLADDEMEENEESENEEMDETGDENEIQPFAATSNSSIITALQESASRNSNSNSNESLSSKEDQMTPWFQMLVQQRDSLLMSGTDVANSQDESLAEGATDNEKTPRATTPTPRETLLPSSLSPVSEPTSPVLIPPPVTESSLQSPISPNTESIATLSNTLPAAPIAQRASRPLWYVRVYEYRTSFYKTFVIKPHLLVSELLDQALKKTHGPMTAERADQYELMECTLSFGERVMHPDEVVMQSLERFAENVQVYYYFKKKSDFFPQVLANYTGQGVENGLPGKEYVAGQPIALESPISDTVISNINNISSAPSALTSKLQAMHLTLSNEMLLHRLTVGASNEKASTAITVTPEVPKARAATAPSVMPSSIFSWSRLSVHLKRFVAIDNTWRECWLMYSASQHALCICKCDTDKTLIRSLSLKEVTAVEPVENEELLIQINTKTRAYQFQVMKKEHRQVLLDSLATLLQEKRLGAANGAGIVLPQKKPSPLDASAVSTGRQLLRNFSKRISSSYSPSNQPSTPLAKRRLAMRKRINQITELEYTTLRHIVMARLINLYDEADIMRPSVLVPLLRPSMAKGGVMRRLLRSMGDKPKTVQVVFGVPLEQLLEQMPAASPSYDQKFSPFQLPPIFVAVIQFLLEKGLNTNGIFRIPGSAKRIDSTRKAIDKSTENVEEQIQSLSVHDVAGLLKLFLRELPDPLLTHKLFAPFIKVASIKDADLQFKALQCLIMLLPTIHRQMLEVLLDFLSRVAEHADVDEEKVEESEVMSEDGNSKETLPRGNQMHAANLATVFAPNILREKRPETESGSLSSSLNALSSQNAIAAATRELESAGAGAAVVRLMIERHHDLWWVPTDVIRELANMLFDMTQQNNGTSSSNV